ncbi:coatomer gamma subunit [Cardiosporidium cionae]|uniref:Coatomer subunit gamma n=1 Tax=Cardiosporidium cionae TaxID=476202 RepID=A0ABQ7J5M1_9APIC|nr:coatomer gamma subunit [Cardiosporidium cionae]|eukprot:KAF8819240.1 coatomer gamma subunit [Cardiosporidium cionae]
MMMAAQSIREKLQGGLLKDLNLTDDKTSANPFAADKNSVLMETRRFTESTLNPKRCRETLVKVIFLIIKGEGLTSNEGTELFFSVTRLFQSSDQRLRRMVYLIVKFLEVRDSEVFILTSSLTKDMNSGNDCYRANAMRVLSKIVDTSMATQVERYLKVAVVDKNPFVASSALLCGMHLWDTAPEVVKRWVNEVTETVNSKHPMVQFHALALLYELKKADRLALRKVLIGLTRSVLKSPYAECLVIRFAVYLLLSEQDVPLQKILMECLEKCLHNKNEMVMFEAAKAFCYLATVLSKEQADGTIFGYDLLPATTVLQIFLSSSKPVFRFAAMRQLNQLAQTCPFAVMRCDSDVETLLTDPNSNIASMALTTLLKIGHESNIDRLIKQITSVMCEVSDLFKLDIIRAVKALCLAYPSKHRLLMSVLSTSLREEGNFELKCESVNALNALIEEIPDSLESGLNHLCDFIEDCEYIALCMQILAFLGEKVPSTSSPAKFIRFIYNRLILENAHVRAAGVDALMKISKRCPDLRKDILILLESCTSDNDDEVRDRTILYYKTLEHSLHSPTFSQDESETDSTSPSINEFLNMENSFSLDALCEELGEHIHANCDVRFDVTSLPTEFERTKDSIAAIDLLKGVSHSSGSVQATAPVGNSASPFHVIATADSERDALKHVGDVVSSAEAGEHLLSSKLQVLTEREAEYNVAVRKHFYKSVVVLEFSVTNTLPNQILENVEISLRGFDEENWYIIGSVPIKILSYDVTDYAYVVLGKVISTQLYASAELFQVSLRYIVKDCEDDLGFEDEYSVEQMTLSITDCIAPHFLRGGDFKVHWDHLEGRGRHSEQIAKFSLPFKSLAVAVESLINTLNMAACDKSDAVDSNKVAHNLLLSGFYLNNCNILCKANLFMSPDHGCVLKLTCRCLVPEVCAAILESLE